MVINIMAKRKKGVNTKREIKKKYIVNKRKIYFFILLVLLLFFSARIYFIYIKQNEVIKETISVNGREFIFSKKANVKNTSVIILLHGGTQNSETWFQNGSQGDFTRQAINKGHAIISPESLYPFCENIPQWDFQENSSDIGFLEDLFNWIGLRDDLDSDRIYVAGISVGGFMASRLAHNYPHKIKAIAIHSAGNADNVEQIQDVCYFNYDYNLSYISPDHPRTLLIHGTNDTIIPYNLSLVYYDSLKSSGVESSLLLEPGADHFWYDKYNQDILGWFNY